MFSSTLHFKVLVSTGGCATSLCTILGLPDKYRPHLPAISHLAVSLATHKMSGLSLAMELMVLHTLRYSLQSVAMLTTSMLLFMPGELSVLVPCARLSPTVPVMISVCLGSASHSKHGQSFTVCPHRTIRFSSAISFNSPSSRSTPRTFTVLFVKKPSPWWYSLMSLLTVCQNTD